jgi:hypothetical protein
MISLVRYQAALLLRSQRWIPPALMYAALVAIGGSGAGGQPLSDGLDWSAAMLVPALAWLTRSMLTAEPAAARACVSAAGGPRRAHLAALIAAQAGGVIFAILGAGYALARCTHPHTLAGTIGVLAAGLTAAGVCALVGGAIGTFCNPPLVRRPGYGILGTAGAVILALVSDVSPAGAALRGAGSAPPGISWRPGLPVIVAAVLLAASWTASTMIAARRGGG